VLNRRLWVHFSEDCWSFLQNAMEKSPSTSVPDGLRSALQAVPVVGRRASSGERHLRIQMTGVELHVLTDWLMSTTNALAAGDPSADLSRRCLAAALARLRGS
jgi:hypothetical protein